MTLTQWIDAIIAAVNLRAPLASPVFTGTPLVNSTTSIKIPAGTTAQRPATPANGYMRYNTDLLAYEGYNNGAWASLGGGATGTGTDKIFNLNGQTVTASYTIPSGNNAVSAGPITIADGVTVTILDGSTWSIV